MTPFEFELAQTALVEALHAVKHASHLARKIGISRQAIDQWRIVPVERVLAVEAATGVPKERLRPDYTTVVVQWNDGGAEVFAPRSALQRLIAAGIA